MRSRLWWTVLFAAAVAMAQAPDAPAPAPKASPLTRKYQEDELLGFAMHAKHSGRLREFEYSARARGIVRRESSGAFYEEFAWSDLAIDGKPVELPTESQAFRERLSLDPRFTLRIPNLAPVHPNLIGPVLDLLNFYADLGLAARMGLAKAGDHMRFPHNRANSWADGRMILVGEDALDFDLTLESLDEATHTAVLVVKHVAPENPAVNLVAEWMKEPVAGGANNWTQIGRYPPGKYTAAAGNEVIDVRLTVDTTTGKLRSATMNNPVDVLERECDDLEARRCGAPVRHRILRRIEVTALP